MDEEDLIEEIEDNNEEQPSSFPRRTLNGGNSKGVPNALLNRTANNRNKNPKNSNSNNDGNSNNQKNPNGQNNDLNNQNGLQNNNKLKRNGLNSSKDSSIANKLKKKNKLSSFFNRNKKKQDNENKDDNNNENNDPQNQNENQTDEMVANVKKKILMIKIGLIIGGIVASAFVILFIVYYVASIFGVSIDFSGLGTTANLDPSLPYYAEAKKYHENLDKASKKYSDSCGVFLNKSYIHATLTYLWNISDLNYDEKKQYKLMADNTDDVAKLMVDNCIVDYDIGGTFYKKLRDSNFLKKYYKVPLEYMDAESIVKGIFEYTEMGIELSKLNSGFISDNLKVTMGTCEYYRDTREYTNNLLNEGTSYASTVGFSDYIKGVIMAEKESSLKPEYKEFVKAFTIVTSSYVLSRTKYESGQQEIWVHNGDCWQASCDINEGCTYCKDLPGNFITVLTGMNRSCNNIRAQKDPMSEEQRMVLDEAFEEVFGTVMIDNATEKIMWASHRDTSEICGVAVGCLGQEDAKLDALNGMTYKEILDKYYNNFTLSNMSEDLYVGDVTYDDGGYNGNVVYYDQTDYKQSFCGLKRSIKTDGCGVTSMAMVLSTFVDKSYTPPVVMQEAYAGKYCGGNITGTSVSFFKYSAQKHGLSYSSVGKDGDKQQVIDALNSGKSLVIAHMGPGTFTNSGHYIVLTKINENGQVYVLDSNNSRRTGWHDFNSVVTKQLKSYGSFHIITKR